MSRISALFALQQVDTAMDNLQNSLRHIENALADTTAVEAARQAGLEAEKTFLAARSKLRDLENSSEDTERHAADIEKKLYGGLIKGNKELQAAQHEVANFRQRHKELDDQVVEAMIVLEEVEAAYKTAKAKLVEFEAEWKKSLEALTQEKERLEGQLPGLKTNREQKLRGVMPPDVPLYEKLRTQKHGVAVAEILNGKMCGGCRVDLPLAKRSESRSGMNIVNCPGCGRILYIKI